MDKAETAGLQEEVGSCWSPVWVTVPCRAGREESEDVHSLWNTWKDVALWNVDGVHWAAQAIHRERPGKENSLIPQSSFCHFQFVLVHCHLFCNHTSEISLIFDAEEKFLLLYFFYDDYELEPGGV